MKYLSLAALFGDALAFVIINKKEYVDEHTVKMAIKGGIKFIINSALNQASQKRNSHHRKVLNAVLHSILQELCNQKYEPQDL